MQARPSENCIISSLRWVPKGCFSLHPKKADLFTTNEEIEKYKQDMEEQEQYEIMRKKYEESSAAMTDVDIDNDEELKEYNMADYDNEEEIDVQQELFKSLGMSHVAPENDVYLKRNEGEMEEDSDEEEEELKPTDYQLVSCHNEDEGVSTLQVHIYEPDDQNLFVHHDVMLQNFALCVEWLSYLPGSAANNSSGKRNLAAVGTFDPIIEIWDLDVVDALQPVGNLGSVAEPEPVTSKSKKKKAFVKPNTQNDKTHTAPVLSLAWHPLHYNILASSSEDRTIKVWDLQTCESKFSLNQLHSTPITGISWHPREANVLLSGGFDKKCLVIDSNSKSKMEYSVPHDVESVAWNPHFLNAFTVSLSSGIMMTYDIRNQKTPIHKWQAHAPKMAVSDFSYSEVAPNLLVTCSHDGTVKFWNQNCAESAQQPQEIESADIGYGQCYTVSFYENFLAIGAQKGKLQVLNCLKNEKLRPLFAK